MLEVEVGVVLVGAFRLARHASILLKMSQCMLKFRKRFIEYRSIEERELDSTGKGQ